jgi:hypothetical protein
MQKNGKNANEIDTSKEGANERGAAGPSARNDEAAQKPRFIAVLPDSLRLPSR